MKRLAATLGILICLWGPAAALAETYQPEDAGHPVRIVAYVLHPVGWLIDRLIFFPAWWIAQKEPLRTIFGVQATPSGQEAAAPLVLSGDPDPPEDPDLPRP